MTQRLWSKRFAPFTEELPFSRLRILAHKVSISDAEHAPQTQQIKLPKAPTKHELNAQTRAKELKEQGITSLMIEEILRPQDQQIMLLVLEGYTYPQIADKLNDMRTAHEISQRAHKLIQRMKQSLAAPQQ